MAELFVAGMPVDFSKLICPSLRDEVRWLLAA